MRAAGAGTVAGAVAGAGAVAVAGAVAGAVAVAGIVTIIFDSFLSMSAFPRVRVRFTALVGHVVHGAFRRLL